MTIVKRDPNDQSNSSNEDETNSLLSNSYQTPAIDPSSPHHQQHYQTIPTTSVPIMNHQQEYQPHFNSEEIRTANQRARKRFFTSLLYGFLIWIAAGLLVGTITFDELRWRRHIKHINKPHLGIGEPGSTCDNFKSMLNLNSDTPTNTVTSSSLITKLMSWNPILSFLAASSSPNGWHTAKTTYPLPIVDNDSLWFKLEGGNAKGEIEFIVLEEGLDENQEGRVEVEVEYYHERYLDQVIVCMAAESLSSRGGFKRGIEIFAPTSRYSPNTHPLIFHLKYYLPPTLRSLESFQVESTNFLLHSHSTLPFPKTHSISLQTSNSPIVFDGSLTAVDSLRLDSSNGPIIVEGLVESKKVRISTSNSHIRIGEIKSDESVDVHNANGFIQGNYSIGNQLYIQTSNSKIDVNIALLNKIQPQLRTYPNSTLEGDYKIKIRTTNGNINVNYIEQPNDTYLDSDIATFNSPIKVKHHEQFEGKFSLSTSNAPLKILGPYTLSDPFKLNRKRTLVVDSISNHQIDGSIIWESTNGAGKSANQRGTSWIRSSNSPAEVIFA